MTRHLIPFLALTAFLTPLPGEEKSVTVSESALSHSVEFGTPTPGSAIDAASAARHALLVENGSSRYRMDTISVVSDSNSDTGSWRCVKSTTSLMRWKILALRDTPLAYVISGGLTETGQGGRGSGTRTPDKKSFSVEVPAATTLRWNNALGSHANSAARNRLRVAVGEQVVLYIQNSHLGNPVWTASGGFFMEPGGGTWSASKNHQPSVVWCAPSTPEKYTVTATFPRAGQITGGTDVKANSSSFTFEVVAPSGETVAKEGESIKTWASAISAEGKCMEGIMNLRFTLTPRDVNYSNTLVAEENTVAATVAHEVKGYYANPKVGGAADLGYPYIRHNPTSEWTACDGNGTFPDTAGQFFVRPIPDGASFRWEGGSYYWSIPAKCRGADPVLTPPRKPGDGKLYATLKQNFLLEVSPAAGVVGVNPMIVTFTCTKEQLPSSGSPSAIVKNSISVSP